MDMEDLMRIEIGVILLAGLFILPAVVHAEKGARGEFRQEQKTERKEYRQEQKSENKAFRETLKGKTGEERAEAIKSHHEVQQVEKKAFNAQQHQENMTALKNKLANNTKLSDAQKAELIEQFESQYQENVSFRDARYAENVAFFEQIANNADMTQEQKKAAIKAHFATQKAETKEHVQQQHTENKALRQKIRAEVKK